MNNIKCFEDYRDWFVDPNKNIDVELFFVLDDETRCFIGSTQLNYTYECIALSIESYSFPLSLFEGKEYITVCAVDMVSCKGTFRINLNLSRNIESNDLVNLIDLGEAITELIKLGEIHVL